MKTAETPRACRTSPVRVHAPETTPTVLVINQLNPKDTESTVFPDLPISNDQS